MGTFIKALEKKGYSPDLLKKKFESPKASEPKIDELITRHMNILRTSVSQTFEEARLFRAVDMAYDAPKDQTTATFVRDLMSGQKSAKEVHSALVAYGLKDLLRLDVLINPTTKKSEIVDIPTFWGIFVPFVMAYVKFRWAKLSTERDTYPTYKYEPAVLSRKTKLQCDIVTSAVERMSSSMGYGAMETQTILPALLYGKSFTFAASEYFTESRPYMEGGEFKQKVVKEGILYVCPHTAKVFYDRAHPLYSLNSDTGTRYAGYFDIVRYSEIKNDETFWNRDKISYGANTGGWFNYSGYESYSGFYPCQAKIPNPSALLSTNQREEKGFMYQSGDMDSGVSRAVIFEKIVPKDWGLYDYDQPVWHRFIYAGDSTCIHVVPFAYNPCAVTLYDYDANRDINASLALELIPHQDHISNLMSQYLLAVKSNLANLILLDKNVISKEDVDKLQNKGQQFFNGLNFLLVDKTKIGYGGSADTRSAVDKFRFDMLDTGSILVAINTQIQIMERLLGFTPQEVGTSATHEQSAKEVTIVQGFASTRTQFTGGFIDAARFARKRSNYEALMEYGSSEILAEVAVSNDADQKTLEDIGFKVGEQIPGSDLRVVTGDTSMLDLDGFASSRDGDKRIVEDRVGVAMIQAFTVVAQNPALLEAVGPQKLLERFNDSLEYLGVPKMWRFIDKSDEKEAKPKVTAEEVVKIVKAGMEEVEKRIAGGIKEGVVDPLAKANQATQSVIGGIGQEVAKVTAQVADQGQALSQVMQFLQSIGQPQPQPQPQPMQQPQMEPQTQDQINAQAIPIAQQIIQNVTGAA